MKKLNQDEWAKENIPIEERMKCEVCGKLVAMYWMKEEYEDEIGSRCGPCSNET